MSDTPSSVPQKETDDPQKVDSTGQNLKRSWPIWLGVSFFGLVGIALVVSLFSLFSDDGMRSPADPEPETETAESAPETLEEQQQHVSQVVSELERSVLIGDSPTRGNPEADVVLLEFSDFQCPYCARAAVQVEPFVSENESDVLFVYKHLPLTSIHEEALPAALASWAADQQEQFWPFHDALFANQDSLGEDLYLATAEQLGLDIEQFNRDRESEEAKAAIAQDLALASELKLNSTPTFIMNELFIPGAVPTEFFAEALTRLQEATQSQ